MVPSLVDNKVSLNIIHHSTDPQVRGTSTAIELTKKSDSEDQDKKVEHSNGLVLDFDEDASKIEEKLRQVPL